MRLGEVAETAFVLVPGHWPAELARRFLDKADCTHVVIVGQESHTYHLVTRSKVVAALATFGGETTVHQALGLYESRATPVLRADADSDEAPDRVVVVSEEVVDSEKKVRVVGFLDETEPPEGAVRRTGQFNTRSSTPFAAYPVVDAPSEARPREKFTFYVGFVEDRDLATTGTNRVVIENPPPGAECEIILTPEGLDVDRFSARLPLREDVWARFTGTAREGHETAVVRALFLFEGQVIGSAKRVVSIRTAVPRPVLDPPPSIPSRRRNPCRAVVPALERYADLTVRVRVDDGGSLQWSFFAASPQVTLTVPGKKLMGSRGLAAQLIRDLKAAGNAGQAATNSLRNIGQAVFDLMPPEFSEILRAVRDAVGQAPRLLLLTDEAFIPWELALLAEPIDGAAPEFLACQAVMGRWIDDDNVVLPPPSDLNVKRFLAVASRYGKGTGQRPLDDAFDEREKLAKTWMAVPLEADAASVDSLSDGRPQGDVVHFSVHGLSDPALDDQSLLLADRTVRKATNLVGNYVCGATPRFAFMFLNACQVGTAGTTLGQAAGFPGVMVRAGARGFVAPLWEVTDGPARDFALEFYRETFDGKKPVGEVLRRRRAAHLAGDDVTPLAYVYYGSPSLRLNYTTSSKGPTP